MNQLFYPIDYMVFDHRCVDECPHYDQENQYCWHLYKHINQDDKCHAGIQVGQYLVLIYPTINQKQLEVET